jgi:hypothetical protein
LNTCCIGPSGEDDINSTPRATTIESADRLCLASIYNCSTRLLTIRQIPVHSGCALSTRCMLRNTEFTPTTVPNFGTTKQQLRRAGNIGMGHADVRRHKSVRIVVIPDQEAPGFSRSHCNGDRTCTQEDRSRWSRGPFPTGLFWSAFGGHTDSLCKPPFILKARNPLLVESGFILSDRDPMG